ncbi:MAG: hypothetical protein INR72_17900, partial [Williamsia herbipolensis]|nr:hypothetical protein [Williamsia herbipolensis]
MASIQPGNQLRLEGPPTLADCPVGPAGVAFIDGATSAHVELYGSGKSAVALGVVLAADHGDASPTYGDAAHLASFSFTGGTVPTGTATAINDPSFALGNGAPPVYRLGARLDPEQPAVFSVDASGDDNASAGAFGIGNDEDSFTGSRSITGAVGSLYSAPISCNPAGAPVAGWIDWNADGDFTDAGERSQTASCAGGTASPQWTVPAAFASATPGTRTYMRFRLAQDASQIAQPSGLATSGEAEDFQMTLDPTLPTAADDTSTGPIDTPQRSIDLLGNDTPPSGATLDPSSVVFPTAGQPAGATVTNGGKTLTVPNVGTYSANPDGTADFVPVAGYTGTAPPVVYQVTSSTGTSASARLTVTVDPVPVARDDASRGPIDTPQRGIPVLTNDTPPAGATLDPASVVFPAAGQPTGATVTNGGKTVTVPNVGAYTANPDGTIDFVPVTGYTGTAPPVPYRVTASNGTTATATLTTTVLPVPTARDDSSSGPIDTPQRGIDLLGNDTPPAGSTLDPSSVVFPTAGQPTGATVTNGGKTLTVPNVGTYTVNPDGTADFVPVAGYTGTAPSVPYQVTASNGTTATARLTTTVLPVPQASDDTSTGPVDTPQRGIPVLSNDTAPAGSTLDPSSVVFPTAGQPAGSTVTNGGKTVTVPNVGVYTANPDGTIDFVPVAGYTGTAPPVPYRVTA